MTEPKPLSAREHRAIVESGNILSRALAAVVQAVREGVRSSQELDRIAQQVIVVHGGKPSFKGYRGFPASLCVSRNDEVVHGIPRPEVVLEDGDIVGLDLGVAYQGLHTDMATTVPIGAVARKAIQLLRVTKRALEHGLRQVYAGARTGDIGAAIQHIAEDAGFSVVRELVGHGVGRQIHEEPSLPNFGRAGEGSKLVSGMALAIEPMVTAGRFEVTIDNDGWTVRTRDHSLAAHEERTVLVTPHGYELLTPWKNE